MCNGILYRNTFIRLLWVESAIDMLLDEPIEFPFCRSQVEYSATWEMNESYQKKLFNIACVVRKWKLTGQYHL